MVMSGISILVPLAEMRDKEGNTGQPKSLFLDTPLPLQKGPSKVRGGDIPVKKGASTKPKAGEATT